MRELKTPGPGPQSSPKPGIIRRVLGGAIHKVAQKIYPAFEGKDPWFSPGQPLAPKQEEGTDPRRWQYRPNQNIAFVPRSGENLTVTFDQLRSLGQYDLARIIIERLKEGIKAHEWDIGCKEKTGNDEHEGEIADCIEFFQNPDKRDEGWGTWIGELLEDLFVIDAPSLYIHRTRGGELYALEPVDGATIKPLIDERGFKPTRDSGAPAFQQILYGLPYVNLYSDELLYMRRNRRPYSFYGFSPLEQVTVTVNIGLRRQLYTAAQWTDGNIPQAFASMPSDWTPAMVKEWQDYWDTILAGDPQNRARIRWIPGGEGVAVTKFKDDDVYGPFNEFDEYMIRLICYAFGVSPQWGVKMVNKATAQEMGDIEAEYGFACVKNWIKQWIDYILNTIMGKPHLEFIWVTDRGRLQVKRVDRNVKYVGAGIAMIDEVRQDEGMPPIGLRPGFVTQQGGYAPFTKKDFLPDSPFFKDAPDDPVPPTDPMQQGSGDQPGAKPPQNGKPAPKDPNPTPAQKKEQALQRAKAAELATWERWALKRFEKQASLDGFEPEWLEESEASEINEGLSKASAAQEIKQVFSAKRDGRKAVELKPMTSNDLDDKKHKLRAVLTSALEGYAREAVRGK